MNANPVQVSVVLPCREEEQTIGACVAAARRVLEATGLPFEIVVADNDSMDASRAVAEAQGARVLRVTQLGYGNALRAGLSAARGAFLIFMDADMSYEFGDIPKFIEAWRDGAEVVIGSRFRGAIDPGAMPLLHRLLGTPVLTRLANMLFRCNITDINCGMRGLTREAFAQLDLHAEGMEFASEMMIKAAQARLRIAETPIQFHMDQRFRAPHLRSFRDGWRHLQLMMHFCSIWYFLAPGAALTLLGMAAIPIAPPPPFGLLLCMVAHILSVSGMMILLLGVAAQGRVKGSKFSGRPWRRLSALLGAWIKVENGVVLGALIVLAGCAFFGVAGLDALRAAVRDQVLLSTTDMRWLFFGLTLFMNGLQIFSSSLLLGLFGIRVADEELGLVTEDAADSNGNKT
jgi:hypothetical protein